MKVKKLRLRRFRNISETEFFPDSRINILVGKNGQGKTSILEALGYLSTFKSFREAHSAEVVKFGEDFSEISCELDFELDTELKIIFSKEDQKKAFINGKGFSNSATYLSQRFGHMELGFHSVVFNPADHRLIQGEPTLRRKYLDRVLAAEDVRYLKHLQKYQRLLLQRNAILKEGYSSGRKILLEGFTESLSQYAVYLAARRLDYLKRVALELNIAAQKIAPNQPILQLFYGSNWLPEIQNLSINNKGLSEALPERHFTGHSDVPSLELIEQAFWKTLSLLQDAEWRAGHTLVGPHRDDWGFFLGRQPLQGHGSQGEMRSALLALKLCEIELFQTATGHRPLLLLDDFSSELDQERRSFLLRFLEQTDLQVFVTTTEELQLTGKRYWVSNGNLTGSAGNVRETCEFREQHENSTVQFE